MTNHAFFTWNYLFCQNDVGKIVNNDLIFPYKDDICLPAAGQHIPVQCQIKTTYIWINLLLYKPTKHARNVIKSEI